jgi:hypothetical protein
MWESVSAGGLLGKLQLKGNVFLVVFTGDTVIDEISSFCKNSLGSFADPSDGSSPVFSFAISTTSVVIVLGLPNNFGTGNGSSVFRGRLTLAIPPGPSDNSPEISYCVTPARSLEQFPR